MQHHKHSARWRVSTNTNSAMSLPCARTEREARLARVPEPARSETTRQNRSQARKRASHRFAEKPGKDVKSENMSASETAFYLSLNPISVSDYERIFMARSGPKLRIRLSMQSTLEMVATNLVDRALAARRDGGLRVELFVKSRAEYVKLPLCLAVSEYLAMTNQGREGNVWYRCKDERETRSRSRSCFTAAYRCIRIRLGRLCRRRGSTILGLARRT